jgi:type IV secretory pathway VirJ component
LQAAAAAATPSPSTPAGAARREPPADGTEPAFHEAGLVASTAGDCLDLTGLLDPARRLLWPRSPRDLPARLRRLPLVEERAELPGRTFAFVFSGDGNWAILVRAMARELAKHGIGSVGLKARTYLLRHRSAQEVARDVEAVLRHYLASWAQERVVLAGLSRGADLLPFVVRRLPADLRDRVELLALFSPARTTNFRFRWSDLLGPHDRPGDVPLLPEIQALKGMPILCVHGESDPEALCPSHPPRHAECVSVDAGHNLDRDYLYAAELILKRISATRPDERAETS